MQKGKTGALIVALTVLVLAVAQSAQSADQSFHREKCLDMSLLVGAAVSKRNQGESPQEAYRELAYKNHPSVVHQFFVSKKNENAYIKHVVNTVYSSGDFRGLNAAQTSQVMMNRCMGPKYAQQHNFGP